MSDSFFTPQLRGMLSALTLVHTCTNIAWELLCACELDFKDFFSFMCMNVLLTCVYVQSLCVCVEGGSGLGPRNQILWN